VDPVPEELLLRKFGSAGDRGKGAIKTKIKIRTKKYNECVEEENKDGQEQGARRRRKGESIIMRTEGPSLEVKKQITILIFVPNMT
jgi:hypothetical protein